jgi:hypothetical protein
VLLCPLPAAASLESEELYAKPFFATMMTSGSSGMLRDLVKSVHFGRAYK